MSGYMDDFFARVEAGQARPLRDVIAADESDAMDDEELDDAVWMALCGAIERDGLSVEGLSPGVRAYYTTRTIEWDVGNGGFAQALVNNDDLFDEAAAGFLLFGDNASADLMRRAQAAAEIEDEDEEDAAYSALDAEVQGPPWNGVPWSDERRVAYIRSHRDEFRL